MFNDATGTPRIMSASLELAAWQGRRATTMSSIEASVEFWSSVGIGRVIGLGAYAQAVLYNGLGRYDAVLVAAQQACEYEDIGLFGLSLVELVEAAERTGARAVAAGALGQLEERARAAGTDWALGMLARSSALLSDGDAAERRLRRSHRAARTHARSPPTSRVPACSTASGCDVQNRRV